MTETRIIEKAIEEIEQKNFAATEQFLEVHKIAYADGKPKISRIDLEKEDQAMVYFHVEDELFFWTIYLDLKPEISVRWIGTEPYHSVYFRAHSDILSFNELAAMTKLVPIRGKNKGDKRHPDGSVVWKYSCADFEPNPDADEFEDKLTKLLDFLDTDKDGIRKLVDNAECWVQVYTSFHNGNTMLGGHYLTMEHVHRLSKLNLAIDFDISANGNFFKEEEYPED